VKVTEAEQREKLRCSDPDARAQWQGWIMAEARYPDVWRYLSLETTETGPMGSRL
jgi:hypothetical protein